MPFAKTVAGDGMLQEFETAQPIVMGKNIPGGNEFPM
jgi:hypothetical protein